MPKPVTNAEIEDVLSSIRRLVSEDSRSGAGNFRSAPAADRAADPADGPGAGAEAAPKVERLVLTPSLRVDEDPLEAPETGVADDPAEAVTPKPAGTGSLPPLTDRLMEYAAAEGALGDLALTEDDLADGELAGLEPETDDAFVAEEMAAAYADLADDGLDLPGAEAEPRADLLPDVEDVTGAEDVLLEDGGFDDGTDLLEQSADDSAAAYSATDQSEEDRAELTAVLRRMATENAPQPDTVPTFHSSRGESRTESLSAKIEALEIAINRTREHLAPEPPHREEVEADAQAVEAEAETLIWQDHDQEEDAAVVPSDALPETVLEPARDVEDEDFADDTEDHDSDGDDTDDDGAEDDFLDEAALRELVAQIVREELQGALGERITRNVRKLVRREIHLALTAQDLD